MGYSEAPRDGGAGDGFPLCGTRRCLHPEACPYAGGRTFLAGGVLSWERGLVELFPGDLELADDLLMALLRMEPAELI